VREALATDVKRRFKHPSRENEKEDRPDADGRGKEALRTKCRRKEAEFKKKRKR